MDFGAGGREGNLATQLNWVPSIHQHYGTDKYKASVGILKMILDYGHTRVNADAEQLDGEAQREPLSVAP